MLCRVCGDRPHWAPASIGWMASCKRTKPDPPDLHQPRLSTLADCFTESPGSSSASPLPYIKPGLWSLFSLLSPAGLSYISISSWLFALLFLTLSSLLSLFTPLLPFRLSCPHLGAGRGSPCLSLRCLMQSDYRGTTHTLCPHHWHTTRIQTRPGHPCED